MRKQNNTNKTGIIIVILIIVLLVSIISSVGFIFNANYIDDAIIKEETDRYNKYAEDIFEQISYTESIMVALTNNEEMRQVLTTDFESIADLNSVYYMIDYTSLLDERMKEEIFQRTVIYTSNESILSKSIFEYISPDIENEDWYVNIMEAKRLISLTTIDGTIYVIYRIDIINELDETVETSAIALSELDLSIFNGIAEEDVRVYFANNVFHDVYDVYGSKNIDISNESLLSISESSVIRDEMIIVNTIIPGSSVSKWKMTVVIDDVVFFNEFLKYFIIIFGGLSIIVFVVFFRLNWIKDINKSVEELTMDDIQEIITTSNPSKIQRIIKNLYDKVESLIQENQELDIQNQQNEAQRREAEIKALLSQISPHYIFNLLDAIHKRALINNETESARMILLMSRQMRRSLEWNEPMVTIKDELDHIKSYIELQQYYYAQEFEFEFNIDKGLEKIKVPKLIFQTLIENALKHGVQSLPYYMQLKRNDVFLSFSITNGVDGKPKDVEKKILQVINSTDTVENYDGIGLENMSKRLQFYYQNNYKVITHKYKQNISITVIIPIVPQGVKR